MHKTSSLVTTFTTTLLTLMLHTAIQAMKPPIDAFKKENNSLGHILHHINVDLEKSESLIGALNTCFGEFFLSTIDKNPKKEIIISYKNIPLSITASVTPINIQKNQEQEKIIKKSFWTFNCIGLLIKDGHDGTTFIPALLGVIQHACDSLKNLPKSTENMVIEFMIINTKLLEGIPFECLNTPQGITILNKTNFGEEFYELCSIEAFLATTISSINQLSFNNESSIKCPTTPFIQMYTKIFKSLDKKTGPEYGKFCSKMEYNEDNYQQYKKILFNFNKNLPHKKPSEINDLLKNFKSRLQKKLLDDNSSNKTSTKK